MFIEAKDDGSGGDNWIAGAISRAKLQSNHHHQQTNIQFFYRLDALPVTQPTVSKRWRGKYHIPWTCLSQAHLGVFQLCLWPLTAPGYLGGGLLCLSSPLWCQYSINILIYLFEKIHWTPSLYSGIMPVICQYDWCTKKCQSLVSEWFSSRQLWIDSGQLNWRCQLTNFDFSLAAFRYFDTVWWH